MFSCGEIHVIIGNRLQQVLGILLCQVVVLFYVWWCTMLAKANLGKVYISTRQSTDLCIVWGEPISCVMLL